MRQTFSYSMILNRTFGICKILSAVGFVLLAVDAAPAVASGVPFQPGDVLVAGNYGQVNHYSPNGTLLDTIVTPMPGILAAIGLDPAGNLYVTVNEDCSMGCNGANSGSVEEFDSSGNYIGTFGTAAPNGNPNGNGYARPTAIVFDGGGNGYVGNGGPKGIWQFPSGIGYVLDVDPVFMDLAPDQCTFHYTGANGFNGTAIHRFNACANSQLTDLSTTSTCLSVRVRPNFEVMAVCGQQSVFRFDKSGNLLQTYPIPNTTLLQFVSLDPDDKSFWVGDYTGFQVVHVDMATGAVISTFATSGDLNGNRAPGSIVVIGGNVTSFANLGQCDDSNATIGCPINVTNGNTYVEADDYVLPGLGGGISIHRTWNSLWSNAGPITQAGAFGDSWRSTYEERLQLVDSTHMKYWRADGSVWAFVSVNGSWSLQSPANQYVTLTFNSNTSQFTLAFRDGSQKVFTQPGYLISIKDRNANTTTVTYDASNRILQVTDAAARSLTFAYLDNNNPNQVTSIADAVGTVASYTYDNLSRLLQVEYADATINSYVYDSNSLMTSVLDNEGKVLESHTYDPQRRGLTSQRANGADLVTVTYGANGPVDISDSLGNKSGYVFTQIANWGKVTSVFGTTCASCAAQAPGTYTFDSRANRTSSTDALGNTTTLTYDGFNDVLTSSIQVGGNAVTRSFTYNSFGEILTATDPLGFTTTNTYDAKGNLLTSTTPSPGGHTAGSKTTFTYNTQGEILTVTDPLNHVYTLTYTTAGLVASITDAQNNKTQFQYDTRANRKIVIDPLNQQTTFSYDSRNRLTGITYPTTPTTSVAYGYDSRGRRTSFTDANGRVTTYTYDDADRLATVTDAQTPAGVTQYVYDSENNLTSVTDAMQRITQYQYNPNRTLAQTIFPSNLTETYAYDGVNNLVGKTDRKQQTISYMYDALHRLTRKQYPDQTQVNYTYDAGNRLTQITDPTGTYQLTYDNMGRLTQTSTAYSFISGKTFPVSYAWDAASNLTSLTDTQRGANTYTYDSLNRLSTLKNPDRNQLGFTYDSLGRRTQLARPNSVQTNYQYDSVSHLTSLVHEFVPSKGTPSVLDGADYSYDAAGNRLSRNDRLANILWNYTYDPLYQVTGVLQGSTTTESYSFDAVGNRLASLNVSSYTYDTSNELINQPGVTYAYDDNGNLMSKTDNTGITSYSWDFEDRLTQITLPGGAQVNFKYDPMGRRIQKSSSSSTVNYVYDGVNVLEELDASGNVAARYTLGLNTDEPLSINRSGTTSYFEADGLGSITSLTNASGSLASTYGYGSFGNVTSTTGNVSQPYRFTSRELDSETGLYYYRARYYDSTVGRFVSEDPIAFHGGDDFYVYVHNNSTNLTDPLGLCPDDKEKCLKQFYESRLGTAVEFLSPLSIFPGWSSNWWSNAKEWGVLFSAKILGAKGLVHTSRVLNSTSFSSVITGEAITVEPFTATAVNGGLHLATRLSPWAFGAAAITDAMAHLYCSPGDPNAISLANMP